jgi:predicted ArsR family transcriptional regulator
MQKTKNRIIDLLETNGGLTTSELGHLLGISATAVRRHLTALEAQNVTRHRIEQRGMGRPSYIYELKAKALNVFSQSFTTYASSILKELVQLEGDQRRNEFIDRRHEKRHQKYIALTKGDTLTDRVASLARLMESEGRMTTWQQVAENRFIFREHNCPFLGLNREFDYPCRCELSLLREALKARVKRVGHILRGDVTCAYEIEGYSNGKHIRPQERRSPAVYTGLTHG